MHYAPAPVPRMLDDPTVPRGLEIGEASEGQTLSSGAASAPREPMSPRALVTVLSGFAALVVAISCTSSTRDAPANDEKAAAETKTEEKPAGVEPVTEAEAKAVVEAWLAAQTERNFDAYAGVYADDFEGIKRNGHNTTHLEREAWLESRRKSFERGFSITATGLKLASSKGDEQRAEQGAMVAHFTQRWSTPNFADIGPKELVIARRGDGVKLVHEEMLASHVTRRKGRTDPPLMVLNLDGGPYVVLGDGDPEWAKDEAPAELLNGVTVSKPLVRERVSKSMLAWIGREVEVIGKDDARCKATIADLEIVGRVEAAYELDNELYEIMEAGGEPTDEQLARSMWSMITPDLYMLGKLDGCAGDLAVPVDATAFGTVAAFAMSKELNDKLAVSAREAFVALKDYRQEQETFVEEYEMYEMYGEEEAQAKTPGPWDEGGTVVEQLWTAEGERFVFRSLSVGAGCGHYTASLWTLWRVADGDTLELVASGSESGDFDGWSPLRPTRLVRWQDSLWLLTNDELYEVRAKKRDALLIHATEPVFFGCNC